MDPNTGEIEITLTATEHAAASGKTKTATVEEHLQILTRWKAKEHLPFEAHVPKTGPKGYVGRHSEPDRESRAKVDIQMVLTLCIIQN